MKCQIGYRYRGYSRSGHPKEPVSGMCDPRVPSVSISDLTFHSIPPLYYANNIYFLDSVKVMCSKRIGVPIGMQFGPIVAFVSCRVCVVCMSNGVRFVLLNSNYCP